MLKVAVIGHGYWGKNIARNFAQSEEFSLDFEIGFDTSAIDCQERFFARTGENFKSDIARARTFGFEREVNAMRDAGLALGGSLQNAVVIGDEKILNEEGLRYGDEFVRHKILDCIGDLYTSGYRIVASIECSRGGHYLTNQLLRKVFQNKENFSIIEIKEKNLPHTLINKNFLRSIA